MPAFIATLCMAVMLVACSAPPERTDYPDMGSPLFNNYYAQCSQCHAPSLPSAHTAAEWPSVIARMQMHRIERRIPPIMAADMVRVRDYLTRYARADDN